MKLRIFVGWPYEVTWVRDRIVPLIETYGAEALTGESLEGQVLTDGVKDKIRRAHAAIFFTNRRGEIPGAPGAFATSPWVVDEIKHAQSVNPRARVYEIREQGVTYDNKIHDERQYTILAPGDVADAMLHVAKAVSQWRGLSYKLQLLPEEFMKSLRPRLLEKKYNCTYELRESGQTVFGPEAVEIVREGHGLCLYLHQLPESDRCYIEISVKAGDDQWTCGGIQVGTRDVVLEKL
jgi:hypothetical protein